MDRELHTELVRRGVPSADNSANVDAWNTTCLQRHVQRVRMERQLALAALVAAGLDVLHTDASVIFVRDVFTRLDACVRPPPPGQRATRRSRLPRLLGQPTHPYPCTHALFARCAGRRSPTPISLCSERAGQEARSRRWAARSTPASRWCARGNATPCCASSATPYAAGWSSSTVRDLVPLAPARFGGMCGLSRIPCVLAATRAFDLVRRRRVAHDAAVPSLADRWNNVVDQMGWSFLVADTSDRRYERPTSQLANESTFTTLGRCKRPPSERRIALRQPPGDRRTALQQPPLQLDARSRHIAWCGRRPTPRMVAIRRVPTHRQLGRAAADGTHLPPYSRRQLGAAVCKPVGCAAVSRASAEARPIR
jgi:hypothetical protein